MSTSTTRPGFAHGRVDPASGTARRKELVAAFEAERHEVEAGLIRDLGRPPSARDRLTIETLSASLIRARRLRAVGRSDLEERRLIVQLQRAIGLRPQPIEAPKVDPLAAIKARYARPPIAQTSIGGPDAPASETRTSEAGDTDGLLWSKTSHDGCDLTGASQTGRLIVNSWSQIVELISIYKRLRMFENCISDGAVVLAGDRLQTFDQSRSLAPIQIPFQ
jgi:hypothetical protein